MTGRGPIVKVEVRQEGLDSTIVEARTLKQRTLDFMDAHPRAGWYIAVTSTVNVLLNLLNLLT